MPIEAPSLDVIDVTTRAQVKAGVLAISPRLQPTAINAFMTLGLTLDQGAADDEVFSTKSSDVGHTLTTLTESDTYCTIRKSEGGSGGARISGYKSQFGVAGMALYLDGVLDEPPQTTKTIAGIGVINIVAGRGNGAGGGTNVGADGNLISFRNWATTVSILDAEGTLHLDLGGNSTAVAPALTFAGETGTGLYRVGANDWALSAAGTALMRWNAGGVSLLNGTPLLLQDGTGAAPSLTFVSDPDTGLYRVGGNVVGMAAGGAQLGQWSSTRFFLSGNHYLDLNSANGLIRHYGAGLALKIISTSFIDFDIGTEQGPNSLRIDDANVAAAAPDDTAGGNIYVRTRDGGADTDSSGGEDGADLYIITGDGSAGGGGAANGGDGADMHLQAGMGGAGAGMGANGSDGLVIIEKSDNTGFWDDMRVGMGLWIRLGVNDPTLSAWQPTGAGLTLRVYEFTAGDEVFFSIQVPHDYLEGSSFEPHVHWTPRGRGVAETGNSVFWRLDYTISNVDGTFPAGATVQLHDTCDGTNEKHQMTDPGAISGVGITISAEIVCRLYRAAGDTWAGAGPGNQPALLQFDMHYQTNSTGSRTAEAK